MKRVTNTTHQPSIRHRVGVTLTEVLVALMIMSIGLTLVASLFPVAALRTLQATQLTNATILRNNADALITMMPNLVFDPDRDGNLTEHFQLAGQRNYVVDPIGFYTHYADLNVTAAQTYGGIPRFGGGLHRGLNPPIANLNDPSTATPLQAQAIKLLASTLAELGDGWTTQFDGFPSGLVGVGGFVVGVSLPDSTNLSNIPYSLDGNTIPLDGPLPGGNPLVPDPGTVRVVIYSGNGEFSQSYPLTNIVPNAVAGEHHLFWSEILDAGGAYTKDLDQDGTLDVRGLPNEFFSDPSNIATADISRIVIQTKRASDYSWMLSVRRRSDGLARSVDVVVRYSNGVDLADEVVYPVMVRGDTTTVGIVDSGSLPNNLRRGNFMFDPINAVWHRIRDVQPRPTGGWSASSSLAGSGTSYAILLTLEDPILPTEGAGSDWSDDRLLNGSDMSTPGAAVFPTGIVDVFPLGSRQIPDSLR